MIISKPVNLVLQLSNCVAVERKIKVHKRAEYSHLLMRGCVDGHALATMCQDSSVLLFMVRHSSRGLKDVGPYDPSPF
jgi:hypothetical protein